MPNIFFPENDPMARFHTSEPKISTHLGKILELFGAKQKVTEPHPELMQMKGRIHDYQDSANELLSQLKSLHQELSHALDPELQSYFGSIVGPLILEIEALQKKADKADNVVDSVHIHEKYAQWILKARDLLLFFETNPRDRDAIVVAVVKYTSDVALSVVNRETKFIRDYLETRMSELDISQAERLQLRLQIEEALGSHVDSLQALRGHKENITLEELGSWKHKISEKCGEVTHAALDEIDSMIQEANVQLKKPEGYTEHLRLDEQQMEFLETEAPQLLKSLEQKSATSMDDSERLYFQERLHVLEDQARELEQDILLAPPLYQRLNRMKKIFNDAQELLDH